MATFRQVQQLLSDVLPIADVASIVCEYAETHRAEWTKKTMQDVCIDIHQIVAPLLLLQGRLRQINRLNRYSSLRLATSTRTHTQRIAVFEKINKTGQRCQSSIDKLYRIGVFRKVPIMKRSRIDVCDLCQQKKQSPNHVHRVGYKSHYMCEQCDTHKIYTPGYATGFRALPNMVQKIIVDRLNDGISLLSVCRELHARKIDIGVSYETLFRWMKHDDMA